MEENQDPIKELIIGALNLVQGRWGDIFIIAVLCLCALAAYKRAYRMSVGFFVLAIGTVLIRVLITSMF